MLGDLAGEAAGFGWMFVGGAVVKAVPAPDVDERELNEEPEEEEAEDGAEGKGGTGCLGPDEEIEDEGGGEEEAGEEESGL